MSGKAYDPETVGSPLWKLIDPSYPSITGNKCSVKNCEKAGKLTCTGCFSVAYCSRQCQKEDWKVHKGNCAPFKMATKPGVGRHLMATRDIQPGEIIFIESPIAVGPKQYTSPVCLGCHGPTPLDKYRCSVCNWPLCGPECQTSNLHRAECKMFGGAGVKPTPLRRRTKITENGEDDQEEEILEHPMYECITPMRVCMSALYKPENWSVVKKMETHRSKREMEESQLHNKHNVVAFLLKHAHINNILPDISDADITLASDVLDVNAFEIRGKGGSIRGLYPLTAMMNSSCSPNTQNSIDTDFSCTVRAIRPIKKGEEICDTYTSTLTNTTYRRKQLMRTKYFGCTCLRCADPTELGSNFSTLLCRTGSCTGNMLCTDPLNFDSDYRCVECGYSMSRTEVDEEQEAWEARIEATSTDIQAQERILEELGKVYHRNHNMCIDVIFNLIPLFGRNKSCNMEEVGERKERLCELLLETMNLVIPGMFRIKGMILAELYSTRLFMYRQSLEAGKTSKPAFVRQLCKQRSLLAEARTILSWEPVGSIEHARLQSVNQFLKQLDEVANQAGQILEK